MLQRSSALATLIALAVIPAGAAQADTSGTDIVGYVNAQRAANGIPAGITEDTAASAACASWLASGEEGTRPAGVWSWSDVTEQGPWTATNDPFKNHPDELQLVLAPRLASFGAATARGVGCATFNAPGSGAAPAHDVTYTYPGDGTQDVRTAQPRDGEMPPQRSFDETGPVLFAFFDGPDLDPASPSATQVTDASLTGPGGAPVAFAASPTTPSPTSAAEVRLVPRAALAPFTTYHASVTADVTPPGGGAARSFTKAWSFTTGGRENQIAFRTYSDLDANIHPTGTWVLGVGSRAPQVTMTATQGDRTITQSATSPDYWTGTTFTVPLARGFWHVCFTSGGDGTDYRPASACEDINSFGALTPAPTPQGVPVLVKGASPKPAATKLGLSIGSSVKAKWRGRTLSVPVRCSAACTLKVAGSLRLDNRKNVALPSSSAVRKSAGTVTIKYTMSKSALARLQLAKVRKLRLRITPKGGKPFHAVLLIARAK
ncbi:Ig-like domain-containing protein [Conexibacter woesei]|uniref:Ig-like domain-containing protein n=1 Tax=Conexibacter woesei TaxID=191495 RepID=UPI0012DD4F6B|nr:Ig-like domain-containing protein [Conexibacter woesei]